MQCTRLQCGYHRTYGCFALQPDDLLDAVVPQIHVCASRGTQHLGGNVRNLLMDRESVVYFELSLLDAIAEDGAPNIAN